ncbi:hypothetical protein PVA45_01265 [Entomospira entomophila]|uniref:Uncharacterized protein n=1 Tax=Entomospira entomophila TaxID=2719988 RepID=A0A968GAM1_9SPIO|nr:hypothetical protein [Entomospira entomophilus]NIZ40148.1 hypothetical protein [Entomospira entomophilus]WDI35706.1 hypothetical protein PVA45_01265 [Entomospira entomophilus]
MSLSTTSLHLDLTQNQAVAIFLSLKELEHVGPETGLLYKQLEDFLYERIGLSELHQLEDLYTKGEL